MQISKTTAAIGALGGGGGIIGTAAIANYLSSSETPQQSKPRVSRKITKDETTVFQSKISEWVSKNGNCMFGIKRSSGYDLQLDNVGENIEIDSVEGILEALNGSGVSDKCQSGKDFEAEKIDGVWVFRNPIEIYRKDIYDGAKKNGNCKIAVKVNDEKQEANVFENEDDLEEIRGYLDSDVSSCQENTMLVFEKNNGDETETGSFTKEEILAQA